MLIQLQKLKHKFDAGLESGRVAVEYGFKRLISPPSE